MGCRFDLHNDKVQNQWTTQDEEDGSCPVHEVRRRKPGYQCHKWLMIVAVESQGKKCHTRAIMHSEADKVFKMNTHHVPLRQIVVEIRLEKE